MEGLQQLVQKNARRLAYAAALALALAAFAANTGGSSGLSQAYGYLSFSFLCLSLAVSPVRVLFPSFKYNAALYIARRALGVAAFVFAFLHFALHSFSFYKGSLQYFPPDLERFGMALGAIALAVFFALAATSFDFAVKKLGRRWFSLHKLTYLAYLAIIAHACLEGSHFGSLNPYSGSFLLLAAATLLLEAARLWKRRAAKPAL